MFVHKGYFPFFNMALAVVRPTGVKMLDFFCSCIQFYVLLSQQWGGGTPIFSCIRKLGSFWGVQNFVFQYFLGFQKNEYFWVRKFCGYFFGIITKLDYI